MGRKREFRPFAEARAFVHTLKLKNSDEWRAYCQSGTKPEDIPSNAHKGLPRRVATARAIAWAPTRLISKNRLGTEPSLRRV